MRFQPGDEVIVHRYLGQPIVPPQHGIVEEVYGHRSLVFDYSVRIKRCLYGVCDTWLAPERTTISETVEWTHDMVRQ